MRFLRTSQCFGSHDPFFSREAASEGSMTVSVVHAQGVAWAVLAGWCLRVTPRLPCLIWAMPEDGPPGKVRRFCGGVIAWLCGGTG
jgi:hypothetical protein